MAAVTLGRDSMEQATDSTIAPRRRDAKNPKASRSKSCESLRERRESPVNSRPMRSAVTEKTRKWSLRKSRATRAWR